WRVRRVGPHQAHEAARIAGQHDARLRQCATGRRQRQQLALSAVAPAAQVVAGFEAEPGGELRGTRPLQLQTLRRWVVTTALAEVDQPTSRARGPGGARRLALADHADAIALHLHLD